MIAAALFSAALTAQAQETLPEGGEGFEDAALLEPGSYESGDDWLDLEEAPTKYFYIEEVKPGQMIKIDAFLEDLEHDESLEVSIYSTDREELARNRTLFGGEGFDLSWLTSSSQPSSKYYIKLSSEHPDVKFTLDVELVDKFDGGKEEDAGDKITDAMELDFGEYQGYISCSEGEDTSDFYKLNLNKGQTVTARLTPDTVFYGSVRIYNDMRQELVDDSSGSYGAIIETVFQPEERGDYFFEVYRDTCESREGTIEYTLLLEEGGEVEAGDEPTSPTPQPPVKPPVDGIPDGIGILERGKLFLKKLVKLAIGAGVLILVVVVLIFVLKSRGKKKSAKKTPQEPYREERPQGTETQEETEREDLES